MALPLKTGADLYNQQLIRARLQNLGAQPNTADVGLGQVYFNTGTNTAASLRIGYCYETGSVPKFHHVANLEDINRLEELISALSGSSSESVASVLGRVITLEGYFSNGKAKDADLLDGHNSDYFATATTVNDLLEDYEAFKAVFSDNSDEYINTWTEVKDFLDGIKNTEDLNAILLGINTELGKKADKATTLAGYGITDAAKYYGTYSVDNARYGVGYDNMSQGSVDLPVAGGGFIAATQGKYGFQIVGGYSSAGHMFWRRVENDTFGTWRKVLDDNNYSDLITDLNNNLNVPSITIGGIKLSVVEGQLQIEGDAFATGQLSSGGIGSEGSGSGASGIVILEDWEKYDDTLAQVLGAGLGVGLRDKIAALESKATNVSVVQTLTSGKEIGAITIDGVATKLYAPSTYDHTEITGLASNYLKLSGGYIKGNVTIEGRLSLTEEILMRQHYLFVRPNSDADWVVTTKNWGKEYSLLHAGNYESIVGNKFLKLSGGELTGRVLISVASQSPLLVKNTAQEWVGLGFAGKNNNGYAFITYNKNEDGSEAWVVTNDGWSKVSELLHSDNYYKYAPKLDGTGATGRWDIGLAAEELTDLNDARHGFLFTTTANYGTTDGNKPHKSHAAGLTWAIAGNSDYRAQLASASDDGSLYFRMMSYGTWGDWKTLAFTDSDITGNAASATKLANNHAYTAWGHTFFADGVPQEIGYGKDIKIGANNGAAWIMSDGTEVSNIVTGVTGNFLLGNGGAKKGFNTFVDGNYVYLRYGTQHETGLLLNESGNVGIGTTSPQYKLEVHGTIRAAKSIMSYAKDGYSQVELLYGDNVGWVLSQRGAEASKDFGIYSLVNGVDTCRFRIKEDGNVGIGTTNPTHKLHVNGAASIGTSAPNNALMLDVRGKMRISPNYFNDGYSEFDDRGSRLFYVSESYGWANGTYVYKADGTSLASFHMAGSANSFSKFSFRIGGTECLAINSSETTINGDLRVSGNIIADGQVSSGGVAEAGTGGATGGSALDRLVFEIPANTTSFPCEHGLGTRDISVTIYEDGNDFQQVLADVYLDSTNVARIVFGSATDVAHKVVIIG